MRATVSTAAFQHGNSASVMGTVESTYDKLDAVFYL